MKKLRSFKRGAVSIIAVDDPLMEEIALSLRETADELLAGGNLRLVVDMGGVPYIDSPGLETLLDLHALAEDQGGTFCLASPNTLCRDIITATRLDKLVLIHPTVDEACRSFL
ncbi:MAG: STAS domain-containing protein [Candidatus Eisenbacteria sp.]|nr:STAS domain-containing protein [Candidatus Eisenbacteria bacterium]